MDFGFNIHPMAAQEIPPAPPLIWFDGTIDCDHNQTPPGSFSESMQSGSSKKDSLRKRNRLSAKRCRAKKRLTISFTERELHLAKCEINKLKRMTNELRSRIRMMNNQSHGLRRQLAMALKAAHDNAPSCAKA